MEADSTHLRLSVLAVVCVSLVAALLARLWFLQVLDTREYEVASEENRLRVVHEEGPRGRILDRNGKVIVENRSSIVVGIDKSAHEELDDAEKGELYEKLASDLTELGEPVKEEEIEQALVDDEYGPLELVPVAEDVDEEVELFLAERADEYPSVVVERRSVRDYPYGDVAAHLLGYVGEVNEDELSAQRDGDKPYVLGDEIGKAGVEATYEDQLRGTPGSRTIEVSATEEYLGEVMEERVEPAPGDDVWLTIDIDIQYFAEQALDEMMEERREAIQAVGGTYPVPQGSVVIIDPRNGEIIAMASSPDYDPALLVNGISSDLWEQLNDEAAGQPFVNWAIQGMWAPGSTFKLFTAHAALESGLITTETPYNDIGYYEVPGCSGEQCKFTNANEAPAGTVDTQQSLTVSSDSFYYWIGDNFWRQTDVYGETPIQDSAELFGLGQPTGIDIPGEASGRIPTPERREQAHQENPDAFPTGEWYSGDNIITAIGQGDVLVTPLQLANAYATFANGGTRYQPKVLSKITRPLTLAGDPAEAVNYEVLSEAPAVEEGQVPISDDTYDEILAGLQGVTTSSLGTAYAAAQDFPPGWPVAGKTGTAEVAGKADTSVFVGFGPSLALAEPQYVIASIIPESGFGAEVSAPVVMRIFEAISNGQVPAARTLESQAAVAEEDSESGSPYGSGDTSSGPVYGGDYGGVD